MATESDRSALAVDGVPSAAAVHWMSQVSGEVRVIRDGAPTDEAPLRPVDLSFPGAGDGVAYTVGHPEPLTLGPALRVRGNAASLMVLKPSTLAFLDGLRRQIDADELTLEEAALQLSTPPRGRQLAAVLGSLKVRGPGGLPAFFALATGTWHGAPLIVGAEFKGSLGDMAGFTSAPLAAGLSSTPPTRRLRGSTRRRRRSTRGRSSSASRR